MMQCECCNSYDVEFVKLQVDNINIFVYQVNCNDCGYYDVYPEGV